MHKIVINHLQMQHHHASPSDLLLLCSLYACVTKNSIFTRVKVQEFKSIEPASLTASSSFTYNSFWKSEVSRRMKGFATANAMHAIHHKMISIIWSRMNTLIKALCKQAAKKTMKCYYLMKVKYFI